MESEAKSKRTILLRATEGIVGIKEGFKAKLATGKVEGEKR